jgi:kynurenine formamidase
VTTGGADSRLLSAAVRAVLASGDELEVFDLAMPIDESMPQWPDVASRRLERSWVMPPSTDPDQEGVTFAVEAIAASLHTSTHIDAVVHAQARGAVHGGQQVNNIAAEGRFRQGGAESIPPLIVPFVLIDVAAAAGVDALPNDHEVSVDDLVGVGAGTRLPVEAAVLIRTGNIRSYGDGDSYLERQPGLSVDAAIWLHERGMTLLGTDTAGTEPLPLRDTRRTVHEAMLVERGVYLVENLNLDPVSVAGRTQGIFICLPLKMTGATGSWVRPIAIARRRRFR